MIFLEYYIALIRKNSMKINDKMIMQDDYATDLVEFNTHTENELVLLKGFTAFKTPTFLITKS